jgi:hypothetical protein
MKLNKHFIGQTTKWITLLAVINLVVTFLDVSAQNTENKKTQFLELSTKNIRKYKLTDQELMSLQYYISDTVLFEKVEEVETNNKDINKKSLFSAVTTTRKEILLPKMTPGVAIEISHYDPFAKSYNDPIKSIKVDFGGGVVLTIFGDNFSIPFSKSDSSFIEKIDGIEYRVEHTPDSDLKGRNGAARLLVGLSLFESHKEEVETKTAPGKTL